MIAHWRKGASDSLSLAKRAHTDGSYALALFHCQLAVEKALKALYMDERREAVPPTHNLVLIAGGLKHSWSVEERRELDYLTQYAVAARYDDPVWAEHEATAENSTHWLAVTERYLSNLLP